MLTGPQRTRPFFFSAEEIQAVASWEPYPRDSPAMRSILGVVSVSTVLFCVTCFVISCFCEIFRVPKKKKNINYLMNLPGCSCDACYRALVAFVVFCLTRVRVPRR